MAKNYTDDLISRLKEPEYAVDYLNAVLADDDDHENLEDRFLLALRDVAKAHGFSNIAKSTDLNRQNLYKAISENGNPELRTLTSLLHALGMRISITKETDEAS